MMVTEHSYVLTPFQLSKEMRRQKGLVTREVEEDLTNVLVSGNPKRTT